MNEFLRATGIPFTVIATKADKLSRAQRQRQVLAICRGLQVQPWESHPFSSEERHGNGQRAGRAGKSLRRRRGAGRLCGGGEGNGSVN